jgi:hypothetical protein
MLLFKKKRNSDGFHSFSVEHGPVMDSCELSYIADDFFNAHNRLLPLASLPGLVA